MTWTPSARALLTSRRKCGLSSGAPPVMSSVGMRRRSRNVSAMSATVRAHFLGAMRARIDMAVHAALVAAIADIELQRVEPAAPDRREGDLLQQRQGLAHRAAV